MTNDPVDLFAVALERGSRRLGLKVTKRHATLDMRDLDAAWPTYLHAQSIVVQQEYEVSTREALLYLINTLIRARIPIPGAPPPKPWDQGRVTALLRLTGPIHIRRLIANGYTEQAALLSSARRTVLWLQGDMYREAQQQVIDAATWVNERSESVVLQGYERLVEPDACGFCRMLAGASRKHAVFNVTAKWKQPHPHCKCRLKALPIYRTKRILTARDMALNKAMYEAIKASRDRALAVANAA